MKKTIGLFILLCVLVLPFLGANGGCDDETSDDKQRKQQEQILAEGTSEVGMPAITNFRERKMLKDIYEKRDQEKFVTYSYLFNELNGKLKFIGNSIGYPVPYSTQFTNPQKIEYHSGGYVTLPQADPNGLFSPASSDGTWVMLQNPVDKSVHPVYFEPKVICSPFPLPCD